jgi:ketosteroid isomerase-like protein
MKWVLTSQLLPVPHTIYSRKTRGTMDGIQGTLSRFTAAFSQLDLDGMMICYANDATAFFPVAHHATFLYGKEEIREAFAKVLSKIRAAGFNSIKLDLEDVKVQRFGDASIATFHIRDGDLSRRTLVLTRSRDEWLIQHLHASNAPLEETQ